MRWRSAAIVVTSTLMVAVAAPVPGQGSKAILLLHALGQDSPGRYPFDTAFARAVDEVAGVELYIETLDPNRFGRELLTRTRSYLREKYAGKNIAAVAVVYDEALAFLLDEGDPLFPTVPVAAVLLRRPQSLPERVSVILVGNTVGDSVSLALKLNPRARHVAIIDGANPVGGGRDALHDEIQAQIRAMGLRIPVLFLHNLPLDELLTRVQALTPDGIIFFARQYLGPRGESIGNIKALGEVARVARVPVFVSTDTMVGAGGLGGVVIPLEGLASDLAKLALRISDKGSLPRSPTEGSLVPMFDWRELRRWGIDERLLPPGSQVKFREMTVWDQYRWHVVGAVSVILIQTGLLGGLVVQRARRRRTEEQNQDLAGRLITVQEEERTRIARDLHDDVSQQLAGLAIMVSSLKRKASRLGSEPEIDPTFTEIQQRLSTLAQAIRDLSHELHPSALEHAGLEAALRRHCADIEEHHPLTVSFSAVGPLDSLSPELALCLFRVAQEALTNAVRHARARTVHVDLMATHEGVELRVTDDGIGFVTRERAGGGLGLRSIDERVRLARGHFGLESQPGRGTTLLVRIPSG